jgi:hypothetical protein
MWLFPCIGKIRCVCNGKETLCSVELEFLTCECQYWKPINITAYFKLSFKHIHSPTYIVVTFLKSWRQSDLSMRMVNFVRIHKHSTWNPKSSTLEPDRPQRARPAACVIAQQYSSGTFLWLQFHSLKKKRKKSIAFQKWYHCSFLLSEIPWLEIA